MGGAAGHMSHPYEVYKDAKSFINFFDKFLSGEYECTEKVDGLNLFVGYNISGDVVALRNKNEGYISNINERFPLSHCAYTEFISGWKAIKSKLENLSKEDRVKYNLIDDIGCPKSFINLEILFGYIPNVVPYSKTTNYIVFHSLEGVTCYSWYHNDDVKFLKKIADKLDSVATNSSEILYTGEPGEIKKERKSIKSYWKFKGPIIFTKNEIKNNMDGILQYWKKTMEYAVLSNNTVPIIMTSITKKLGKFIVNKIKSKLSDNIEKMKGCPGIEGLVVHVRKDKVKITGDFLEFNRPINSKTFDAIKSTREYIQKDLLNLNVTTLRTLENKTVEGLKEFVLNKRNKNSEYELSDHFNKEEVISTIDKTQEVIKKFLPEMSARKFEIKNLLSQSYLLSKFKDELIKDNSIEDLIKSYGKIFYRISK